MTSNWISFSLVALSFVIGFGIVPALVLPRPRSARNRLDEVVINFIRWTCVVLVATHLLAIVRLYETVTLLFLAVGVVYFTKMRPRGYNLGNLFSVVHLGAINAMSVSEANSRRNVDPSAESERGELSIALPGRRRRRSEIVFEGQEERPRERRVIRPKIKISAVPLIALLTIPIFFVLGQAFWLRLQIVLANDAMPVPDAYVHMTWAKDLAVNQIWPDGIYPMGMPSMITYVGKLSVIVDTADVTRFLGPIVGMLVVFGIFYCALRLTRNPGAAILAAGAFGLYGTRIEWHEPFYRQVAALPQEMAIAITFLALPFAVWAVQQKDYGHLVTLGCAGATLAMMHPVPIPVFAVFATVAAAATAVVLRGRRRNWVIGVAGVFVAGAIAGMMYIPLGIITGHGFYGGLTNFNPIQTAVEEKEDEASTPHELDRIGKNNGIRDLAVIATIGGFVASAWLIFRKRARAFGAQVLALSAVGLVVLLFYNPQWLPLDSFYTRRFANSAGPWMALVLGLAVAAVSSFIPARLARVNIAATVLLGCAGLALFGNAFPPQKQFIAYVEYSSMVTQTQAIKADTERYTYTMVGTPEQRQRLKGSSFFIDLWVFARDVRLHDARNPAYQLPVPTEKIFVTVEKVPFPGFDVPAASATDEYYRDKLKRGRIMTIVGRWMETYSRYHDDVTVYYDDDNIRIYMVERTPDIRAADASDQFKDYEWKRGVLFNEGPATPALGGVDR